MNTATILVVDDEPQLRRAMKATLTDLGYSVIEAKTGEEALEKLRSDSPDLVLLDLNMPGIGGLETCRAIRETSDVPIIVLSVRNTERDKVQALDAGADDYVTKPFGIQELLARIRAAMRRVPVLGRYRRRCALSSGELEIDFEARRVTLNGNTVAAHAERIRPAEVPGRPRQQADPAPQAAANRLGSGLRRRSGVSARGRESAAQEDRTRALQTAISADRTLGRLSLRHPRTAA